MTINLAYGYLCVSYATVSLCLISLALIKHCHIPFPTQPGNGRHAMADQQRGLGVPVRRSNRLAGVDPGGPVRRSRRVQGLSPVPQTDDPRIIPLLVSLALYFQMSCIPCTMLRGLTVWGGCVCRYPTTRAMARRHPSSLTGRTSLTRPRRLSRPPHPPHHRPLDRLWTTTVTL